MRPIAKWIGAGLVLAAGLGAFVATISIGQPAPAPCLLGEWLGMPTDQCRTLCGIDPGFIDEARTLAADLAERREAFAASLENPQSSDEAILARSEEVMAAHNALECRVVRHLLLIRPHLTPAQQQRLMGLCAEGVRRGPDYRWPRGRVAGPCPDGAGCACEQGEAGGGECPTDAGR